MIDIKNIRNAVIKAVDNIEVSSDMVCVGCDYNKHTHCEVLRVIIDYGNPAERRLTYRFGNNSAIKFTEEDATEIDADKALEEIKKEFKMLGADFIYEAV